MKQLIAATFLMAGACTAQDAPQGGGNPPGADADSAEVIPASGSGDFSFDQPSLSLVLPDELRENSGLTVLTNGLLATVQDEDGTVYTIDPESGAVVATFPFGDAGDYEGIEWVGDVGFVLRSDGTLIELGGGPDEMRQTRTFETSLKRKNDTEGLGYDSAGGRLLVACKEDPGNGLDKDERAIYSFDPTAGELSAEPVYVLDAKEIERQLSGKRDFKPSAVAVHPSDGRIYVLSATGAALAVLGAGGSIQTVHELDREMFEQAEGLAFAPDGTLYISSEGADGPPMLYQFSAR